MCIIPLSIPSFFKKKFGTICLILIRFSISALADSVGI
jgi:hypothetical protein